MRDEERRDEPKAQRAINSMVHPSAPVLQPLLESREASKIYRMGSVEVVALDHVTMGVGEGEFVAIRGTSGSGKSTLLNMLGGLDQPSRGEILFESRSLTPF